MILRVFYKDSISISLGTHELAFWISQMCIPSPWICNWFSLVFIHFYRFPLMFHGFNTSVSPESSGEVWGGLGSSIEVWGGLGSSGQVRGGLRSSGEVQGVWRAPERSGEVRGGLGSSGEVRGGLGRSGELRRGLGRSWLAILGFFGFLGFLGRGLTKNTKKPNNTKNTKNQKKTKRKHKDSMIFDSFQRFSKEIHPQSHTPVREASSPWKSNPSPSQS